jgi:hypothetical protein
MHSHTNTNAHRMRHNLEVVRDNPNAQVRDPHQPQHSPGRLEPLSRRSFQQVIKRRHGHGIRLRIQKDPHLCKWCEGEEEIKAAFHAAVVAADADPDSREKQTILRKAKLNREHMLRHKDALGRQRAWLKTQVLAKLKPDEALIQMDFVCTHTSSFRPIHTFVLAIHTKAKGSGTALEQFVNW